MGDGHEMVEGGHADGQRRCLSVTRRLRRRRLRGFASARLSIRPQAQALYSAAAINRPLAALRHLLRFACGEWEVLPAAPRIRLERESQG